MGGACSTYGEGEKCLYWHSALTLQHHSVFPPFCVHLICKATTHRTTDHTVQSVLCCCYQNTPISASSVSTAPVTIAQYTKLITNTLIVLTKHHKIDANHIQAGLIVCDSVALICFNAT
jgi:hypothetical protein